MGFGICDGDQNILGIEKICDLFWLYVTFATNSHTPRNNDNAQPVWRATFGMKSMTDSDLK